MQTTKAQILALLKGWGTIETLAADLSLAPMTVHQHVSVLDWDALTSVREERQTKGRPHFVYQLTEIRDFNSVYRRLSFENAQVCAWHRQEIGQLVDVPAQCNLPMSLSGACCRYVVAESCNDTGAPHEYENVARDGQRHEQEKG
ncbi:MAG: hypothetical protein ACR2PL_05190 [Dehalococcoidia bacterium]